MNYMVERRSCLNGKISFFTHLVSGRIVKIAIGFQGLLHYKEEKLPTEPPKPSGLPPETISVSHKINTLSIFLEQVCLELCLNAEIYQMAEVFSPYNKCILKIEKNGLT